MNRPHVNLRNTVLTACLVVGAVAISAIAFNYAGKVQLRFGADGIQLQIEGRSG